MENRNRLHVLEFLVLFLFVLMLSSCGGDSGSNGSSNPVNEDRIITLKGDFSSGIHSSNTLIDELFNTLIKPAYALNSSEVIKVLAVYPTGKFYQTYLIDSAFTIEIVTGASVGIIFLGENDSYLGYLTFGSGIDTLPLNKVPDGVDIIDFGTLSFSGFMVKPSINPLGTVIPMTPEEQSAVAIQDDNLASIVKNPDVDDNGIIDYLENKLFMLSTFVKMDAGVYDTGLIPTLYNPPKINGSRLWLNVKGSGFPDKVYFTGPEGSGLDNSLQAFNPSIFYGNTAIYFAPDMEASVPPAGDYFISYDNQTLTFTIENTIDKLLVYIVPEIVLNDDESLHKIRWSYMLSDGVTHVESYIPDSFELQLMGGKDEIYSFTADKNESEHILSNQGIVGLKGIEITYDDSYGNTIIQGYQGYSSDEDLNIHNSIEGHALLLGETDHSGITITLYGNTQFSTTTDQSGFYHLSGMADGTYSISASKDGYITENFEGWIFENTHHTNVDIMLDPNN